MGFMKLRLSMLGTLAIIIGLSALFLTALLSAFGAFNILTLIPNAFCLRLAYRWKQGGCNLGASKRA